MIGEIFPTSILCHSACPAMIFPLESIRSAGNPIYVFKQSGEKSTAQLKIFWININHKSKQRKEDKDYCISMITMKEKPFCWGALSEFWDYIVSTPQKEPINSANS